MSTWSQTNVFIKDANTREWVSDLLAGKITAEGFTVKHHEGKTFIFEDGKQGYSCEVQLKEETHEYTKYFLQGPYADDTLIRAMARNNHYCIYWHSNEADIVGFTNDWNCEFGTPTLMPIRQIPFNPDTNWELTNKILDIKNIHEQIKFCLENNVEYTMTVFFDWYYHNEELNKTYLDVKKYYIKEYEEELRKKKCKEESNSNETDLPDIKSKPLF